MGEVTPDVASDTAIVLGVRDPLKGSYLAMIPPTGVEARESRHDTTERRDLAAAFQPREGQRRGLRTKRATCGCHINERKND